MATTAWQQQQQISCPPHHRHRHCRHTPRPRPTAPQRNWQCKERLHSLSICHRVKEWGSRMAPSKDRANKNNKVKERIYYLARIPISLSTQQSTPDLWAKEKIQNNTQSKRVETNDGATQKTTQGVNMISLFHHFICHFHSIILLIIFHYQQQIELPPSWTNPHSTMVNYTCAARHQCRMNNPQTTADKPCHHCAHCRKAMCGSLCGQLLSEKSVEIVIPLANLSEYVKTMINSPSALICNLCLTKVSVPNSKMPATVTEAVSMILNTILLFLEQISHSLLVFYILISPLKHQHQRRSKAPLTPFSPKKELLAILYLGLPGKHETKISMLISSLVSDLSCIALFVSLGILQPSGWVAAQLWWWLSPSCSHHG